MEPVTQGLLGAAVGQLAAPSLGRRALLWGALVGMAPDLDVLVAPLHDGFGELVYHRGSSHALWFGFAVGPPLGWLLWRWRDAAPGSSPRAWILLCVAALVTHPLLDVFTPYGTQLFAPFDRTRFAFHGVGIVDPFYTAFLAWAVLGAARAVALGDRERRRTVLALALSSAYLVLGVGLNEFARRDVAQVLGASDVRVYPTVLQPFLRRAVVRDGGEIWVGWHSTLAPGCPFGERFPAPKPSPEARDLAASWEGRIMAWFAMDDVVLVTNRLGDGSATVEMEDLRYGLPGQPPERSMWGVRARYDPSGARVGPVERFRRSAGDARLAGFGDMVLGQFTLSGLRGAVPRGCAGSS